MATQFWDSIPLLSVVLRSFALLAMALLIALLCRRRSAAVQHHIWVLGIGGCLLIPTVALLPNLSLPLLAPPQADEVNTMTPAVSPVAFMPTAVPGAQSLPAPSAVELLEQKPASAHQAATLPREAPSLWASLRLIMQQMSPETWLLLAWATGTLGVLARQFFQTSIVRRALRQCREMEDETWHGLRDSVARDLGLRRAVPLRSHPGAASPMVVGLWHSVVLLPNDADKWTTQRRRQVLLHELAHVRRRDVLTQTLAELACALYWFNPLAWWGAAQMKRLREIACDGRGRGANQQAWHLCTNASGRGQGVSLPPASVDGCHGAHGSGGGPHPCHSGRDASPGSIVEDIGPRHRHRGDRRFAGRRHAANSRRGRRRPKSRQRRRKLPSKPVPICAR